jgi:hypothetical protein
MGNNKQKEKMRKYQEKFRKKVLGSPKSAKVFKKKRSEAMKQYRQRKKNLKFATIENSFQTNARGSSSGWNEKSIDILSVEILPNVS